MNENKVGKDRQTSVFFVAFDLTCTLIWNTIFTIALMASRSQGLASTKFGLIKVYIDVKPNWILGAVQKSDVQQRFRRTAPARLTRLLKSKTLRSQTATA
ncbi:hypothetical protein B4W74_06515 [Staphylococcus intermedius]|nr:hypothetical protein B4W74_06515 [Staphylococcus intermedius]